MQHKERMKPFVGLLMSILAVYVMTWFTGTLMLYSTGSWLLALEIVFALGNFAQAVVVIAGLSVQTKFTAYIRDKIGSSQDLEMERYHRDHSVTDNGIPVIPVRHPNSRLPSIPNEEPFYSSVERRLPDHNTVETERDLFQESDSDHDMTMNAMYQMANREENRVIPDISILHQDESIVDQVDSNWFNDRVTPSPLPPPHRDAEDDTTSQALELLYQEARNGNQARIRNRALVTTISNEYAEVSSRLHPHLSEEEEEPWYKSAESDIISNRNTTDIYSHSTPPPPTSYYAEIEVFQEPHLTPQPKR